MALATIDMARRKRQGRRLREWRDPTQKLADLRRLTDGHAKAKSRLTIGSS